MVGWSGLEMPGCYVDMDAAEIEYMGGFSENQFWNIVAIVGIVTFIQASGIVLPEGVLSTVPLKGKLLGGLFVLCGAPMSWQTGKVGIGDITLWEKEA